MRTTIGNRSVKFGSAVMSVILTFSLIPQFCQNVCADTDWKKNQSNTYMGTSKILSPTRADENVAWSGNYVYFGNFSGPIKNRVLSPNTDVYGGKTMFLDSNDVLFMSSFDKDGLKKWDKSDLKKLLNGSFLQKSFSDCEQAAIHDSNKEGGEKYNTDHKWYESDYSWNNNYYELTVGVSDTKIFLLDAGEVSDPQYGYNVLSGRHYIHNDTRITKVESYNVPSRAKNSIKYWLRTASNGSGSTVALVDVNGEMSNADAKEQMGVAPALNINLDSILFSSLVSGEAGKDGAEYKLTIYDENMKVSVPSGKKASASGRTVTIPYNVSGSDSSTVNRLSVLILNKELDSDDASKSNMLYYAPLEWVYSTDGLFKKTGEAKFTLPDNLSFANWGKNYYVYVVAESLRKPKETDYASKPQKIDLVPSSEFVTDTDYNSGSNFTFDVRKPYQLPSYNEWWALTYLTLGTTLTNYVKISDSLYKYDIDMDGHYDVQWDLTNPPGVLSKLDGCNLKGSYMLDNNFTFILSDFNVKVGNVRNGTLQTSVSTAVPGEKITVTANPNSGYRLLKITYIADNGVITDITNTKKFNMPNSDVIVSAVFEKIANATTPTPTPTKKPTATPTSRPNNTSNVSLTLNKSQAYIVCGNNLSLSANLTGSNATITWVSSDSNTAAVDSNGLVKAKRAGVVTITAKAAGKTAKCNVTVLYKDVTDRSDFWFEPTYYLTEKGVVKGYNDQTLFKPANKCTRAQMVTFLWRLAGEPAPGSSTCRFNDVSNTDYYYKACIWGSEQGIVEGYSDGTFGPQIVCARKHAVTFMWRMAGKPNPSTSRNRFSDVNSSDYFYKATLWASEKGILAGYDDGTFRPDGDCLRRQMVTFLYKYDKNVNT